VAFFVYSLCPCPRFVFLFNDIPPTYEKKKKRGMPTNILKSGPNLQIAN
jgi:hypothetical protein